MNIHTPEIDRLPTRDEAEAVLPALASQSARVNRVREVT